MKQGRGVLRILLAALMVLTLGMPLHAAEPTGYAVLAVEKFTVGQGYILEPVRVPIYAGDTVSHLVVRALSDRCRYGGNVGQGGEEQSNGQMSPGGFYLKQIKDPGNPSIDPPQYILDAIYGDDDEYAISGRVEPDWLGEFDYTFMSGWMYSVNNSFPNRGAGEWPVGDGDVIRWQFTLWGYGADIGGGYATGLTNPNYRDVANRDALTAALAACEDKSGAAYRDALAVAADLTASQSRVNSATSGLGEPQSVYMLGDVNNDGQINTLDALLVQYHRVGRTALNAEAKVAADVNGDGNINALDALLIQYYRVGRISEFPAQQTP